MIFIAAEGEDLRSARRKTKLAPEAKEQRRSRKEGSKVGGEAHRTRSLAPRENTPRKSLCRETKKFLFTTHEDKCKMFHGWTMFETKDGAVTKTVFRRPVVPEVCTT